MEDIEMNEIQRNLAVRDYRMPEEMLKKFPTIKKECYVDDEGKLEKRRPMRKDD